MHYIVISLKVIHKLVMVTITYYRSIYVNMMSRHVTTMTFGRVTDGSSSSYGSHCPLPSYGYMQLTWGYCWYTMLLSRHETGWSECPYMSMSAFHRLCMRRPRGRRRASLLDQETNWQHLSSCMMTLDVASLGYYSTNHNATFWVSKLATRS